MTQTPIEQKMTKARTALLLDHPFFGSLALRLRLEAKPGMGSMATDGTSLFYDPAFVEPLSIVVLQGCIAHEVMHCALLHPFRKGARDHKRFNIACDYAINPMIVDAGMQLPPDILLDRQYAGMNAEMIYARLPADPPGGSGTGGDGAGGPLSDDVLDPPKPEPGDAPGEKPAPRTANDWQIDVEQITIATQKAGKAPAGIVREVAKARESRVDWRARLHRFVEQVIPSDYSWSRPNRRHIAEGVYLPGQVKENFPRLGIGVDTSGSITGRELAVYSSELDRIMRELRPAALDVIYCDSQIAGRDEFSPDGPAVKLRPVGGGGTAFQPVLDAFSAASEPPVAVIYFTDLYGPAPKEPDYPVLWVTSEGSGAPAPFGELVRVEE